MKQSLLFKTIFETKSLRLMRFYFGFGILIFSYNSFGQVNSDSLYNQWKNTKLPDSTRANAYLKYISQNYVDKKADSAYLMTNNLLKFCTENKLKLQEADAFSVIGNILLSLFDNKNALVSYKKSLTIYKSLNYKKGIARANTGIGSVLMNSFRFNEALDYFNETLEISKEISDTLSMAKSLLNIGNVYSNKFKIKESSKYYYESLNQVKLINNLELQTLLYTKLGDNLFKQNKFKEALALYDKSLKISKKINNQYEERNTLFSISVVYFEQKKYNECISYSIKCLNLSEKIGDRTYYVPCLYNISDSYKAIGNIELAYEYLVKASSLDSQISSFNASKEIQKMEISKIRMRDSLLNFEKQLKLDLEHQRKIQEKSNTNTKLVIGWCISLLSLSFIAFIIYKNTKRKQLQAEQEKEIELQKKEKLLKNIELSIIDAMIEGQEKERQLIANDLHDDLGALMTTIKLNINALKEKHTPELLDKTNQLIDNAYNKIRGVAHVKNSGVIGKKGLLIAVQNMAQKISETNQLRIEVKDYGLEERLENSLEITLFRIIQELITNIIKHSQASEATIHLTNHKNSLNIMVEDNGIGFNLKSSKSGMGIKSIDKRINNLNGTLSIDSDTNKGTTVIIDIPL
ncbi:sensor histidine kinase [Yeosuana marina]|uniref:tetratricopeptide repeat-containing sensor histidine kinase n=1 Tax=Yeosuana marina TaxID=1565536 RepID=UPI0030C7CCDC